MSSCRVLEKVIIFALLLKESPEKVKYDFDEPVLRRGTNSMKWDLCPDGDVIPMWVADMDFRAAPEILEALQKRLDHGVFGYNTVPESYYRAVTNWFRRRHGLDIERDWIMPVPGVVAALSCVIKALTRPGDAVAFHVPAYNCFFSSIRNNGCRAEPSPLKPEGDTFAVDWEDLEARLARPETKLFLLCNPHNPSGRVWTQGELRRMAELCRRHGVTAVADEIHCDIVMPGHKHVPFATVTDTPGTGITLVSPTKGFNIAGLQIANIVCGNPEWRGKIDRAVNDNEVCDLNPFGIAALEAAYDRGEGWLDELNEYIWGNYLELKDFLERETPRLKVCRLEGTYLVWVDTSALEITAEDLAGRILAEGKVLVNGGEMYGDPEGSRHIRINIACPRDRMRKALKRMAGVVNALP